MTKADNRPPTKSRTFEDELNSISALLAKCCNEGNKLLCELAQIPPVCREGFLKEAAQILGEHYLRDLMNLRRTKDTSPNLAVIERFERALRETYSIFLSIPELDRIFLSLDPHEDLPTGLPAEDIPAAVSALLDGPGIPLQGGGFIPKVPPTRMIEEVQAKANKHPL
jgi:hypothetical protein